MLFNRLCTNTEPVTFEKVNYLVKYWLIEKKKLYLYCSFLCEKR
jgi:hypothetical protein